MKPQDRPIRGEDLAVTRALLDRMGAEETRITDGQRTFPGSGVVVETGYVHGEVWVKIKTPGTLGTTKTHHAHTQAALEDALTEALREHDLRRTT